MVTSNLRCSSGLGVGSTTIHPLYQWHMQSALVQQNYFESLCWWYDPLQTNNKRAGLFVLSGWHRSRCWLCDILILLKLNSTKTNYMYMSRKRNNAVLHVPAVNNVPLERVEQFRYLGVVVSSDMSWSPHIQSITCIVPHYCIIHPYLFPCTSLELLEHCLT